jgi:hypothetical protein
MPELTRRGFLGAAGLAAAGITLLDGGGRALAQVAAPPPNQGDPSKQDLVATGDPKGNSALGLMFPALAAFSPDPDPAAATADLNALALSLLDPNVTQPAPGNRDNVGALGSVLTYFGQFIDHDLYLDLEPQPTALFGRDNQGLLTRPGTSDNVFNFETFRFDLSSMYAGGPAVSPQLYAADGVRLLVQEDNGNGVRDVPRNPDGSAVLVEHRNDENQIILQVHVAMIRFHNAVADSMPGAGFDDVAAVVRRHYQWVVLNSFLPEVCGQDVVDGFVNGSLPSFYKPGNPNRILVPVEVSAAAYRMGHSMVRKAYELTVTSGKLQVFNGTTADLHGGRPLGAGRQIDWGNFDKDLMRPENAAHFNFPRFFDTLLSSGLFTLPIGGLQGAENAGSNILAFRNLVRGLFYGLPSGQDVSAAMGVPVLSPADALPDSVDSASISAGFAAGTPLWFYVLREAELAGGTRLGATGARLIADVFTGAIAADPAGLLHDNSATGRRWQPVPPIAPAPGQFTLADLLVFAGVAVRPGGTPSPASSTPSPSPSPSAS